MLGFGLINTTSLADSENSNAAFNEAVEAVKSRDYGKALILFEEQAKQAEHDAQYNLAVLLQAGKGRPQNYNDALYWSWLAQLGGIEEAEDIATDMLDALTEEDALLIQAKVGKNLEARLEGGDARAIPQFADYYLKILDEPDFGSAYIWYSIAAALNIPEMADRRDDVESEIEAKDLTSLQAKAMSLFEKYDFTPFNQKITGGENES